MAYHSCWKIVALPRKTRGTVSRDTWKVEKKHQQVSSGVNIVQMLSQWGLESRVQFIWSLAVQLLQVNSDSSSELSCQIIAGFTQCGHPKIIHDAYWQPRKCFLTMGYPSMTDLHFDASNFTSSFPSSSHLALLSYGSTHHGLDSTGYTITHDKSPTGNMSTYFNETIDDPLVDAESTGLLVIRVLRIAAMVFVMIAAVFGNMLVIISVFRFERLRIIANSFIVSLAFADLTVALLVMPFNASQEIAGKWIFGRVMCDIFNANDVLFSTASLLHLCCISMDRYIAITDPFHYESKMTRRRVAIMLSCVWGASSLISHIPIHLGWYTTEEHRLSENTEECSFIVNKIYGVISSSISFWTPAIVMVFTYMKIYTEARKQEKQIYALTKAASPSLDNLNKVDRNGQNGLGQSRNGSYQADNARLTQERKKMKREHKAAKTLGIIMGAFLLCWLPFFTWYVTTTMCGDACPTPQIVVSILFWVGYFNSALNPLIYAFFNRDFRHAFKRLLRCHRSPCAMLCCLCCQSDDNSPGATRQTCCQRAARSPENFALHSGGAFTCSRPCNSRSDGSASSIQSSSPNRNNRVARASYDTVHWPLQNYTHSIYMYISVILSYMYLSDVLFHPNLLLWVFD